jgi:hypothetical protein
MQEMTKPDWSGYWYHFTDRKNLPSILSDGIRPRGDRPANFHGVGLDSNPNLVYLTNKTLRPWHGMDYDNICVIAITDYMLDESLKRPDEDDPDFSGETTIAYAGVIPAYAIDGIYYAERCIDPEDDKWSHRIFASPEHTWADDGGMRLQTATR